MQHVISPVGRARAAFDAGTTRPLAWRLDQLRRLRRMLAERHADFAEALARDLGKHHTEAQLAEIGFVDAEAAHLERHLDGWLRPEPAPVPAPPRPTPPPGTQYDPLGVVLVIAPWNYPLQLLLNPLVGALAAGNAVVVKPSELAPATSAAWPGCCPSTWTHAVAVVEGGVPETTALLEQRFDHIFYTGNGTVGRIVMRAAAKHLTPVDARTRRQIPGVRRTGVDADVADRLVRGRFLNAGQTCVAPDYVLAREETWRRCRPSSPRPSRTCSARPGHLPEYGRIVDDRHFARLAALADASTVVHGGQRDAASRYFAPTLVRPATGDAVMAEEIFGPLLPWCPCAGSTRLSRR